MPNTRRAEWPAGVLGALLLCGFAVGVVVAAVVHSGVPDEVAVHVPAGVMFLETGRFAGGLGNPPLGQLWVGWPAWLDPAYALFDDDGLIGSRLAVASLALGGALLLWGWVRRLAGDAAGLGALLFLATSPTFAGHSALATLDVPVTVCGLAAVASAHAAARTGALRWFVVLGLALGAAVATKVQGLVLIPLIGLQWMGTPDAVWRARPELRVPLLCYGALGGLVAVGVLHAAYGFHGLAQGEWLPSDWVDATRTKLFHGSSGGHHAYLLGAYSTRGWWSYFPIVFAVKSPVALLAAAAVGAVAVARDRSLAVWLGLPVLAFFGLAMTSSVNIGVRHLLPMYPFLFGVAGVGLAWVVRRAWPLAALLVVVQLGEALYTAPHGLAYFNVFGGGREHGHQVLADSNYDWGQHDPALREYLARTPGPVEIAVDPLAPRAGRILVGASALRGLLGPGADAYGWLREREPTRRIAGTWFEFEVPPDEAPAAPASRRRHPARLALAAHVQRARSLTAASLDPRFALDVASACYAVLEYECALEQAKRVLELRPRHRGAFWLASEVTARRRLGVLLFEGREYLDGFEEVAPAEDWLPPAEAAAYAETIGAAEEIGRLQRALGFDRAGPPAGGAVTPGQ